MKIHFLNHLFGWWSHHQCFTEFRIHSVVKDATTASNLAGAVITRDRKASRKTWLKGVVGWRGRKAWSEDVAERRGRKTWPEGVVGRRGRKAWSETCSWFRANSIESLSPVVCKKPDLQLESSFLVKQDSQPLTKLLEAQVSDVCGASGDLKLEGSLKSLPTVLSLRIRSETHATVI